MYIWKVSFRAVLLGSVSLQFKTFFVYNFSLLSGSALAPPVADTPLGAVGLQICYDLRFPEASLCLTQAG